VISALPVKARSVEFAGLGSQLGVEQVGTVLRHSGVMQLAMERKCVSVACHNVSVRTAGGHQVLWQIRDSRKPPRGLRR